MTGFLLSVNFVQDPIKKVHFPCFCDAEVYYKLIYNQAAPDPPEVLSYKDIITQVHRHYCPKISIIME